MANPETTDQNEGKPTLCYGQRYCRTCAGFGARPGNGYIVLCIQCNGSGVTESEVHDGR